MDSLSLGVLAVQFAIQPSLNSYFYASDSVPSACIFFTESMKASISLFILVCSGAGRVSIKSWRLSDCLYLAGVPAASYAVQNIFIFSAYRHLDGLTFNLVNQTKLLATALLAYLILGKRQSQTQIIALFLLCISAVVAIHTGTSFPSGDTESNRLLGLVSITLATLLSGLGGVLSERAVTSSNRDSFLYSAELALMGLMTLSLAAALNGDIEKISAKGGLWSAGPGSLLGLVPSLSQAISGLIVGYVTKRCGSVKKGFAVIAGLLLTALLNSNGDKQLAIWGIALPLAGLGIWLHSSPFLKSTL